MTTLVRIINIDGPNPIKILAITPDGTIVREQVIQPKDEYLVPVFDEQAIAISEEKA